MKSGLASVYFCSRSQFVWGSGDQFTDWDELQFAPNQAWDFLERRLFRTECMRIIAALMELWMSVATPNT
jgi:hypothetical protein